MFVYMLMLRCMWRREVPPCLSVAWNQNTISTYQVHFNCCSKRTDKYGSLFRPVHIVSLLYDYFSKKENYTLGDVYSSLHVEKI